MANSSILYTSAFEKFTSGSYAIGTTTFKALLVTSSYTPSKKHNFVSDVVANEVSGGSYVRSTFDLSTLTVDNTGDLVDIEGTGVTFTGLSSPAWSARWCIVFVDTGSDASNQLIMCIDLISNRNPTTQLQVSWTSNDIIKVKMDTGSGVTRCFVYNNARKLMFNGSFLWKPTGASAFKVLFLKDTYSPNADHVYVNDVTAQESNPAIRKTLAGFANSTVTNIFRNLLDCKDFIIQTGTFGATDIIKYAVIFIDTGDDATSELIACYRFQNVWDYNKLPTGGIRIFKFNIRGAIHLRQG